MLKKSTFLLFKSRQCWTYLVVFHGKVCSREKVQSVQWHDHQIPVLGSGKSEEVIILGAQVIAKRCEICACKSDQTKFA